MTQDDFDVLIAQATAAFAALPPEAQAAHLAAQRDSWARGEAALSGMERQGAGYDSGVSGHELQGRARRPTFDLVAHLERQRAFSLKTFGPGPRTQGVVDHIRKGLIEVLAAPADLSEWIDVVLLALDGAWRAGYDPVRIAAALDAKQSKNELRTWPDWRTADPNEAIEHDRHGQSLTRNSPFDPNS